jgi:uncharacterized membrane protein
MDRVTCFFGGAAVGALTMYFFDPQQGRRRQAVCQDQFYRLGHETADAAGVIGRDVAHRGWGLAAEARSLATADDADDRVVAERVRAALGRVVSHPRAVEVIARGGRVTLRGPILRHEVDDLLACAASIRGVRDVENKLEPRPEAGTHPALQGGRARPGPAFDLMQNNLAPATRTLFGVLGGGLFAYGLTRKAPAACVLGTVGLALAWPAVSGTGARRWFGLRGRRGVQVNKTITVAGPVERVFPFFARYDAWPQFMRNLREVRDLGNGRSHWVARGPAGVPVSWDAVITDFETNRQIAWRSEPNSTIHNRGFLRFEPAGGDTRVTIHLEYVPPGGQLGHLAAMLFGADPKSEMDDDLARLKGLIEEGKSSAPGKGEVARQEVAATPGAPAPAPAL